MPNLSNLWRPLYPLAPREPFAPPEPLVSRELLERRESLVPVEPHVLSAAVLEQSRSAVWPLMAALVIGLAIGFAGGYGVGTTREHAVPPVTEAQPPSTAPAAAGRDSTEIALAPKPGTASSSQTPAARPQETGPPSTPERRAVSAPERRSASRTQPERPPARPSERAAAPVPAGTSGEFVGRLSVESRPSGARVFLDNKQIGVTPLAMPSIKAGEHAIRLERDGYRHWTSTVRIVAGEPSRVTASFDRP